MSREALLSQVFELPKMSESELKSLWRNLYETPPPRGHQHHLIRKLAYRLQVLAYGIDEGVEQRIAQYAEDYYGQGKRHKTAAYANLIPGTKLVREYKGVAYQVTVLERGYEYQGCRYKSLSKVAYQITGCQWSGPAFFGVQVKKGKTI